MALSREKYPVFQPDEFYKRFPHLNGGNHKPTSKATPDQFKPKKPYYIYNCFAFVVNDKKKFWWPEPYSYWPRDNATESVEEIMSVLAEYFKYEPCNDGNFERGVQKIAIFVKDGVPVHIAIQPSSRSGTWISKMGYNIDMEHDLHSIETRNGDDPQIQGYGTAVKFMKLVRKGRNA